ncbi:MAG: isochorismatase [Candidatus Entotheonella factor]|uniref:Isochorismatase n=1 Tax=Entotheonella factor TaxID=1429438 RepID=W4LZL3_ENTF1|nr:cysteine hydrolase family protein [Candidatus Entotheonella palauensis]ETX03365.1 MAG: isochorismatase [Candidatus Entotheonella factor]
MNALLIIDLQVGLPDDPPRLDLAGVIERINCLAQATRASDGLVIFIQHDGPPGHRLEPHTPGWALLPELERKPADVIIRKRASDAFYETCLDDVLKQHGVEQLLVTGCASEMCVDTTIRAAASRGYHVVVAADGHTTRAKPYLDAATIITHHNWVWEHLIMPDREVRVLSSAELLNALSVTT